VTFAGALLDAWLGVLAPPRCSGCDTPLPAGGGPPFCGGCWPLVERAPDSLRAPARAAAAFIYGGPLADAIVRLKYAGRVELAAALGPLLAEAALPFAGRVESVVPLPLHPSRLRERGFNQSALLAGHVARALGVPHATSCLLRTRSTHDQAGLARAERAANVRSAFVARGLTRGARLLLIDDVRTTGATLAAASEALLDGGASEVLSLVLARAEG
jgi:ComF family protein